MKYILFLILSFSTFTGGAFAQQSGRWIIGFSKNVSVEERSQICEKKGLRIVEDLSPIDAAVVERKSDLLTVT